MSHFNNFETIITDKEALIRALCRCDNRNGNIFRKNQIEDHNEATHLYGYQDDQRAQKANIIIRRHNVGGAANDLGFIEANGTYKAIISDYDSGFYNKQWLGKLTTYYNVEKSKMELDAKGIAYTEVKDAQGRIQLRAKFKADMNASRIQVKL
jgi:hypothetical protein